MDDELTEDTEVGVEDSMVVDGVDATKMLEELGILLKELGVFQLLELTGLLEVLDMVGATEFDEGVELLEYPGTEELEWVGVTKLDEELMEALEEETDEDATTIVLDEDVTTVELDDDVVDTEETRLV